MDKLVQLFQDMIERLDKLERAHTGKSLDEKIEEAVDRKVTEVLEESKEKEQRKLNITVANLPESMVGTVKERRREDSEKVKHLVKKITNIEGGDLRDPIRLGPILIGQNVRPRLLRMVVRTEEMKAEIMRNVYRLNEGVEFADRVYINQDSTPRERETLKVEMMRRVAEWEADLVIRNLQIVKRRPRQLNHHN